jgi:putative peptide zinc metalloprotease protein
LRTHAEGVVWTPEHTRVYAESAGLVHTVLVPPGTVVSAGQPLLQLADPFIDKEIGVLEARLRELRTQRASELFTDPAQSSLTDEDIDAAQAELAHARERSRHLVVRSPVSGRFVVPGRLELAGRFLGQGEVFAYIVDGSEPRLRVVVPQADISLVRARTQGVAVRLAERLHRVSPAYILREVPSGDSRLPSRALGTGGGGEIAVDPRDPDALSTLEKTFQVELGLTDEVGPAYVGGRAFVRFDHGTEPLAWQWYRRGRQLLLSQVGV